MGRTLVCPVHVGLFAHVRLYGVKDNQPRPGLPDSSLYALVGKGKPLLALINDKNTVKVCFGFHKAGLDGVAQTVLGGLVNHIEWLMRCHVGGNGLRLVQAAARRRAKVVLPSPGLPCTMVTFPNGDIRLP